MPLIGRVLTDSGGRTVAVLIALAAAGCGAKDEGTGELHAQKVVLAREVEGLRDLVARLETGGSAVPPDDVLVAVEEVLVRDLLEAQLPFETEVDAYRVRLEHASVTFRGSPLIALEGKVAPRDGTAVEGELRVLGALEKIRVDAASGRLSASVAVDHVDIKRIAGFESFLPGGSLDELARAVRLQLAGRIPDLAIPVRVEQRIDFPALTDGPVRTDAASLPLAAAVSQVFAGRGRLWVSLSVKPGDVVKTAAPK
jgi:hypothetical protein